jgi:hypothetical protein
MGGDQARPRGQKVESSWAAGAAAQTTYCHTVFLKDYCMSDCLGQAFSLPTAATGWGGRGRMEVVADFQLWYDRTSTG